MIFSKALVFLAVSAPLFAQYGGPAVLTRGQAPAAMAASQIDFRPFVNILGGYDYGLNGVGINPNGTGFNVSSYTVEASAGVSGLHSWRHTQVGLDYSFSMHHYPGHSFYDGFDQRMLLSIIHQLSRHAVVSVRTNAGMFTQNFGQPVLAQAIPFDPATTYVPSNDYFNNRTLYSSTQADIQIQKSTRLSYMAGVDYFVTSRRSDALYGDKGIGARGDVQYRLTRRSTIGVGYNYTHYIFSHIFSSTDLHSLVGSYAVRLTRTLELSATAGATRYETKFIQSVPVDPAIAALIGLTHLNQISYSKNYVSTGTGRLSYTMKRGVLFLNGGRAVTPGNGLFLTSTSNTVAAGYNYTALRHWSASATSSYNRSTSLGNYLGDYGNISVGINISRQVARYTHGMLTLAANKYRSPDFRNYNKWAYSVRLGLGFSPGDIPMRLW